MTDVTELLQAIDQGNEEATAELLPVVYHELRALAKSKLSSEKPGQTLQATALVHEAYLRLVGNESNNWNGRRHFFGAAAEAMRRILIESARRKKAVKHGGEEIRVEINTQVADPSLRNDRLLELNDAIEVLEAQDHTKAELVKLKLFAGLSTEETAEALEISVATAYRKWEYCRAWLKVQLGD